MCLSCQIIYKVKEAEYICIIPKEHNGKSCITPLIRERDRISFKFQQETYYYDDEKNVFKKPLYPDTLAFSEYRKSNGLTTSQVREANISYGPNK